MSNLSKLLSKGGILVRQGDMSGARALFEKAAHEFTKSSEPWTNLAAIHGMQGNFSEALQCAHRAVQLSPSSLQGWMNLGRAAQSCGELPRAAEAFQRASSLPGCPPEAILELGITLARMGRWAEAEQSLRQYHLHHPGHREAALVLSKALLRKGQTKEAIAITEAYCRQQPGDLGALLELGSIYHESGHIENAQRICDQTVASNPNTPEVLFFKATLLMHQGQLAEAKALFEQLNRQSPGNPKVLMALSQACQELSDTEASIRYTQDILAIDPRHVPAILSLGSALIYRDNTQAWKLMEQAMSIAPNESAVMLLKAELLEFGGDKLGAWHCARRVIEAGSTDIQAVKIAANVAPAIGKADEAIAQLEDTVKRYELSVADRKALHYTLANLCDKTKLFDRAFEHAIAANRLKNIYHDQASHNTHIKRLKAAYSADIMTTLPRSSVQSELPIFIVGMPRSGTSMMEQILSCHSKVYARGETSDIYSLAEKIPYFPEGARNIPPQSLDILAEAHLKFIGQAAPSATRITDKLPGNFLMLGAISQLFPGARILNCRRDPRDICLSNFMIDFGGGHEYSYNLESLAQVYVSYQELMQHWKQVLSIPILDVRYEELVADPRAQIETVLNFIGLEWEDACLNFHQSERQVTTASYDQVRQPLYKKSVARWKNYALQLQPVMQILDLHGDSYP